MNALPSEFELSTDKSRLDLDCIEAMIRTTHWAAERPRSLIELSVEHSICIGAYRRADGRQVGFARAVTDYMNFAWVTDVMVEPDFRGQGIGGAMVDALVTQPGFEAVHFVLATRDAHGVYSKVGFKPLRSPDSWMERWGRRED